MIQLIKKFFIFGILSMTVSCALHPKVVREEAKATPAVVKKVPHVVVIPDVTETKTQQLAKDEGDAVVSSIKFEKNRHVLDSTARSEVEKMISTAKESGPIEKVTVAVWADREYPGPAKKLNGKQITLARERGIEIQKYLKESMSLKNVEILNMAKTPSYMSKFFKSSDARLKERLVSAGVAPTTADEPVLKGRASTALILVKTK